MTVGLVCGKTKGMTKRQYIEYLLATPGNYTCTNLADHLEGEQAQSHDAISDFLRQEKLTPRGLWQMVQPLLQDGPQSYLIFDDSVQDKRYSHQIELVKLQYSGAAGGLVKGIGVLNLLHSSGATAVVPWPRAVSFIRWTTASTIRRAMVRRRGKTKNQHFREMPGALWADAPSVIKACRPRRCFLTPGMPAWIISSG